jgi:hypothetical protein
MYDGDGDQSSNIIIWVGLTISVALIGIGILIGLIIWG